MRALRLRGFSISDIMATQLAAMRVTIFYSWQSDLPNNTNRGTIAEAASQVVLGDESYGLCGV